MAAAQAIGSWSASLYVWRLGRYAPPIWLGMALSSVGYGVLSILSTESPDRKAVLISIIIGAGIGFAEQPPLTALLASLEYMDMAQAATVFGLVRGLATGISIVIGGVIFQNVIQRQSRVLLHTGLSGGVVELFSGRNALANVHAIWTLDKAGAELVRGAYTHSLGCMWILYSCVSGLGLLCSLFVKSEKLGEAQLQSILANQTVRVVEGDGDMESSTNH